MSNWMRRIRGALGMGLAWAVAWSGAGVLVMLGFLVRSGSRPDAPFPILFGAAGFIAGLIFSVLLGVVDGSRRFERMSLPRFTAWGAAGGFALAATGVVAISLAGDRSFLWNLVIVGPSFALAAGASAAGSLALARRARERELLRARAHR